MALIKSVSGSPDPFATFDEKKSEEYGIKIGMAISGDWFGSGIMSKGQACNFLDRRNYVRDNRLFVRGEQDLQYYKGLNSKGDNDLELYNLDWTIINLVEKFCRIVSNGITEENYRLDIRATDKISVKLKKDKEEKYMKNIITLPMLKKAKEVLNVDQIPQGYIPEDEDELQLFLEIKDRPKIEIAEELLINYIKKTNEWDFIVQQGNKDLVDNGLIGCRVYTDKNDGVKIAYVDPENYIHSDVKRNDFADKYYEGVVDTITLSDLRRESDFTDLEIRQIAKTYGSRDGFQGNKDYQTCLLTDLLDIRIDVLRFAWKTSKTITYKAKKRKGKLVKVSKKSDSFSAPETNDYTTISKTLDTWFEGNYIVGSNAIYGYKECENLARDTMNKAMSPFIFMASDIYENRPLSFLTKIKPLAVQMQMQHLKLQHFTSELTPDIIEVDLDMLAELDDGKGGTKKAVWETALKMMKVKGVVFKKRIDMGEAGQKEGTAVRPSSSSQGSAIGAILNTWAHYYNMIRDITGINPARDGSLQADALLGVNQLAQLASNTATKHITDTAVAFYKKVNEVISSRAKGVFQFKEAAHIREIYENAISKSMFDALEVLKNRHLHEFGFTYEMLPTSQEMTEFKEDLSLALQEGAIDVEVKSEAVRIAKTNVKLASEYLFFHRRKRKKQAMQEQMALSKDKSQNDAMAAQSKVQADMQAYQFKKQIDLQYFGQLAQIEITKAKALQDIAAEKEDKEFQQDVYIEQIKTGSKLQLEQEKEDRKDDRTKIQATQQSKMIKQRTYDGDEIDFQNEVQDDFMANFGQ